MRLQEDFEPIVSYIDFFSYTTIPASNVVVTISLRRKNLPLTGCTLHNGANHFVKVHFNVHSFVGVAGANTNNLVIVGDEWSFIRILTNFCWLMNLLIYSKYWLNIWHELLRKDRRSFPGRGLKSSVAIPCEVSDQNSGALLDTFGMAIHRKATRHTFIPPFIFSIKDQDLRFFFRS